MNPDTPSATRVFIWATPRTCSTALLKCLTFVDDVDAWLGPYVSAEFNQTWHNPDFMKGEPIVERMREDAAACDASESMKALRKEMDAKSLNSTNLIAQEEISYEWVKEQLELPVPGKRFVVVKDHPSSIIDNLQYLPDVPDCRHVLLTRHPREAYVSWKNMVLKRFGLEEDGSWETYHAANIFPYMPVKDFYQIQNRLRKHLEESLGPDPIIVDTYDLCSKPEVILPKIFSELGIPYKASYLEWEAGGAALEKKWKGTDEYILVEAKTFVMKRAMDSSRFESPKQPWGTATRSDLEITPELQDMIKVAMPHYEELYAKRIH